ncbi:hypothetical protein ACF0H5_013263 [Mactra antiquata]
MRILDFVSIVFINYLSFGQTDGRSANANSIELMSFNTGLTPRVDQYDVRREKIGESIRDIQSDVVCLQEVWYSDDMVRIIESTSEMYPYSYSGVHSEVGELTPMSILQSPCLSANFGQVMACVMMNCNSTGGTESYLTCAKERCDILQRLNQQCISCLILSGMENIASRCLGSFGTDFNVPGLLLLSKRPLQNARTVMFQPDRTLFLPRGYLSVEIDGLGTVACAHTTANLGDPYFEDLSFNSWEDQNLEEARTLVNQLQDVQNVVVMGDLNSSPAYPSTGIQSDMPGFYEYLVSSGYRPSYMERVGTCTWCLYNPLAHAEHYLVLDHIFVKNIRVQYVRRVLDENIAGESFPLSDHYGIVARVFSPRIPFTFF